MGKGQVFLKWVSNDDPRLLPDEWRWWEVGGGCNGIHENERGRFFFFPDWMRSTKTTKATIGCRVLCAFMLAGIVRGSVGGACINNFKKNFFVLWYSSFRYRGNSFFFCVWTDSVVTL